MAEGGGSRRARSLKINASFRDRGGAWPASRRCGQVRELATLTCCSACLFCGGGRNGPQKAKVVGTVPLREQRRTTSVATDLKKRRSLAPRSWHLQYPGRES